MRAQEPGDEKKAIQIRPDLPGGEEAQAEGERAQAELQLLKAELAKKHAELKALEHKLQALQERTNNPGAAVTGSKQGQLILRVPEGAEYGASTGPSSRPSAGHAGRARARHGNGAFRLYARHAL